MGGLSAGLNLASHQKKTLILEKNALPGGLVSNIKKGRFEFDTSLYDLYDYGDDKSTGTLKELLTKYDIELETKVIPFNIRLNELSTKSNYIIRGDMDAFLTELERLQAGSMPSLKKFIQISQEIHEALDLLKKHKNIPEEKYPNFYKYLDFSTLNGLKDLGMPLDTINRFSFLWLEIGSPIHKLSFIDFSEFMYKLTFKKDVILLNKALDFTLKLANRYQELGGRIYYNSFVTEVTKTPSFYLIKTKDNLEYKAKQVIFNPSKRYVYKNLIMEDHKEINRLENARTLSPNGVVVYLGLNRSCEELGLKNYKYYQVKTLNSEINASTMTSLEHDTFTGIVPNVVNELASPKNTTILVLKKIFFDNALRIINSKNYAEFKEYIAQDLITKFEEAFKIDIQEYIEEIAVLTPVSLSKYTNNVNGSFYGYMLKGYDNAINRLLTYPEEEIKDFTFVGGSSLFGAHVDNAFYSGYYLTEELLHKEGPNGK